MSQANQEHPLSHEPVKEREFTEQQLRYYTGERGYRMYIAYAGVVYDVTDCPKWRRGSMKTSIGQVKI